MQPQAHLYNASFVLPRLLFLLSTEYKLTSSVVGRLGKHSQDWDNGVQKVSLFQRTLNNLFFLKSLSNTFPILHLLGLGKVT